MTQNYHFRGESRVAACLLPAHLPVVESRRSGRYDRACLVTNPTCPPPASPEILMRPFCLTTIACLVIGFCLASPAFAADPPAWKPVAVPDAWKSPPDGENVFQWYRASVKVPADWKGKDLLLVVEAA